MRPQSPAQVCHTIRHRRFQHTFSWPTPFPRPLHAFISIEAAGAFLLLAASIAVVIWSYSAWGDGYCDFWDAKLRVGFASFAHVMTLGQWVTDGLMVGFFLLIAFTDDADRFAAGKVGILVASLAAGVAGGFILATDGSSGKRCAPLHQG